MKKTFLIISFLGLLYTSPVFAQTDYKLLAPIPLPAGEGNSACVGNETGQNGCKTKAGPYITGIFNLIIAIAGALAVIMIIYGGIVYMSTDAWMGKNDAKGVITNALWGLILVISAWLILFTINPKLIEFKFDIPVQPTPAPSTPGSSGGPSITGQAGQPLTDSQIRSQFGDKIGIAGNIKIDGLRQGVVDELLKLKNDCNCTVTVTSATGGEHSEKFPSCSHSGGQKVDIRTNGDGSKLTDYIKNTYKPIAPIEGNPTWQSQSGTTYTLEGNHWDVARC